MSVDVTAFEELLAELDSGVGDEAEAWLHDPTRTAHRLVTVPTAELVRLAGADQPAPAPAGPRLPGGLWRVLPDRLLSLHPARRGEGLQRARITTTEHLELTALVLERWGWAKSGRRIRTATGGRCILGAQRAVHALGYGTEHTAVEAGRQIQGALADRGITMPYPRWNEMPGVTGPMALGLVRAAAKGSA
jgi:hypothetical protein